MSSGTEENQVQNDNAYVDTSKENVSSDITSDSGVDTLDSCSVAFPVPSDTEISPAKHSEHSQDFVTLTDSGTENESEYGLSSPESVSPDDQNGINFNCENDKTLIGRLETHISPEKYIDYSQNINSNMTDINAKGESRTEEVIDSKQIYLDSNLNFKTFTTSSVSLNDETAGSRMSIIKSAFSKSAENISTIEIQNEKQNSNTKDLNEEEILTQFMSHKTKVGAMQKIPENSQTNQNLDVRYPRIPKELLSQDLGSIVKNVHGIFSSVSGSLKSAYNNTHRASVQKVPIKNLVKTIPNGKIMKEIFEDEIKEEKPIINGVDKTVDTIETINSYVTNQENDDMDCDAKSDVLKLQVESLEKLLAEQRRENAALRDRLKQQIDEMQEKDQTFKDLEMKLDLMSKRVDQAEREKDAAVMRYASVECTAIEARRAADKAAAAERSAHTEVELLQGKLKSAHAEKQRICQLYDDKCHELATSEREVAKLREDLRELEGRLKWTQSKLRVEMDAYKESSERAEKLSQQVTELEAAKEAAAANATDSVKAKQLECELKECRAALILCRHEREELDKRLNTVIQQLDTVRKERDEASAELATVTAEVEQLKASNLRLEEEAAELAALRAQAALADTLSAQLQRESERASQAEASLAESRALAETCARREAAALEHAAKLTAQHVQQRAATEHHEAKVQALAADNVSLRDSVSSLQAEVERLHACLAEEGERRARENKVLARKVAELTEEVAEANKKLEWEKGENCVLKKKHASAIKELNRELQRALKRCEQLEAKLPTADAHSTRTGSVSSLSSGESPPQDERLQNGHADALPDIQVREPDKQALIERIVSLQRAAARRAERCEFLEEHSRQLTAELRSKSRLLRHLLCMLPAGAVASQDRDVNKKEIARLGGGAMAAVWGGDSAGMTLDLSLEMNRRLQAVLEDTLLKNITLKENMDTLGAEISRLKDQKNNADVK